MKTKYRTIPEVIAEVRTITGEEDEFVGDKVTGIQVRVDEDSAPTVQIDVRDFNSKKSQNIILEIELSELVAAISVATLNAEKE